MSPGLWGDQPQLWPAAQRFGVDGVPGGQRVKVRRRPVVSRPGSTVVTLGPWTDAVEFEVDGVGLDRTTSSEIPDDTGEGAVQLGVLWGPTDADIHKGDRVIFPSGAIVEVTGIPNREPNIINGWKPPMSVNVSVTHG